MSVKGGSTVSKSPEDRSGGGESPVVGMYSEDGVAE